MKAIYFLAVLIPFLFPVIAFPADSGDHLNIAVAVNVIAINSKERCDLVPGGTGIVMSIYPDGKILLVYRKDGAHKTPECSNGTMFFLSEKEYGLIMGDYLKQFTGR